MTASTQHSRRLTMTSRTNSSPCLYEGAALELSAPLPGGRVNAAISRMLDGARLTSRLWSEDVYKPLGSYSSQPLASRRKIGDPPLSFNPTSLSYSSGGYAQSGAGARDRLLQRYADRALQGAAPVPRKTLSMRQKSEMTSRRLQEHLVDEVADRLRRELGLLQGVEEDGGVRAIEYGTDSLHQGHAGANSIGSNAITASSGTSNQGAPGHVATSRSCAQVAEIQGQISHSGSNTQATRDPKTSPSHNKDRTTTAEVQQVATKVPAIRSGATPIGAPRSVTAPTDTAGTTDTAATRDGTRDVSPSLHTDQRASNQQKAGRGPAARRVRHRGGGKGRVPHQRPLSMSLTDLTSTGRLHDVTTNGAGSDVIILDVSREDGGLTGDRKSLEGGVNHGVYVGGDDGLSVGCIHGGLTSSGISGEHTTVTSTHNSSNHNTLYHTSSPPHTSPSQPPPPPSYRDASSSSTAGTRRSRSWRDANSPGAHRGPVLTTTAPGGTLDGEDGTTGERCPRYGEGPGAPVAAAGTGPAASCSDRPRPPPPQLAPRTMEVCYQQDDTHHTPVSGLTGSPYFSPGGVAALHSRGTGVHISGSMSRTAEMIRDKRVPPMPSGPPPPPPTHRLFLNNSHLEEEHGLMVAGDPDPDPDPDPERLNDSGVGVDEERSKEIANSIDQELVPEGVNPKHLPILRNKRVFEKELACRLGKKMELQDQLLGDLKMCMEKETMREKVESTMEVVQNAIRTNIYNDRKGNRVYSVLVDLGKFYRHMLHHVEGHTVTIAGTTSGDPEFALTKELSIEFPESVIMEELSIRQIGPTVDMEVPFKKSELMTDLISLVDKLDEEKKQEQNANNILDDTGSTFSDQTSVYSELNELAEKLPELPSSPPPPSPLIKDPKPMRRRRRSNKGPTAHVNGGGSPCSTGSSPTHVTRSGAIKNGRKVEMSSAKLKMASDKETWLKTLQSRRDEKEGQRGRSTGNGTFVDTLHNGQKTDAELRTAGRTFVDTVHNGRHKAESISSIDSVYGSEDSIDEKWAAVYHHKESGDEKRPQLNNVFEPIEKTESKVEMGEEFVTIRHVPVGRPPGDIPSMETNGTVSAITGITTITGGKDHIDAAPPHLSTAGTAIGSSQSHSHGKVSETALIQIDDDEKVSKTALNQFVENEKVSNPGFLQYDEKVSPELVTSVLGLSPQYVPTDVSADSGGTLQVGETSGTHPPCVSLRDGVREEGMQPRGGTQLDDQGPMTISSLDYGGENNTPSVSECTVTTGSTSELHTSDDTSNTMLESNVVAVDSASIRNCVDTGGDMGDDSSDLGVAVTNEGLSLRAQDVTPCTSRTGRGVDRVDIIPERLFTSPHPEATLTQSCPTAPTTPTTPTAPVPIAPTGGGGSAGVTDGTASPLSVKGQLNQVSQSAGVTTPGSTSKLHLKKLTKRAELVLQTQVSDKTQVSDNSPAGKLVKSDETEVKKVSKHGKGKIVLKTVSDDISHGKGVQNISVITKHGRVKTHPTDSTLGGKMMSNQSKVQEVSIHTERTKGHLVKTQPNDKSIHRKSEIREVATDTIPSKVQAKADNGSAIGKEMAAETSEVRDTSRSADVHGAGEGEVHQSSMKVHLRSTPENVPPVPTVPDSKSELEPGMGTSTQETLEGPKVYQVKAKVQLRHREEVGSKTKNQTKTQPTHLEDREGREQHAEYSPDKNLTGKVDGTYNQGLVSPQVTQKGQSKDKGESKLKQRAARDTARKHELMHTQSGHTQDITDGKSLRTVVSHDQRSEGTQSDNDSRNDQLHSIDVKKGFHTEDSLIQPLNQTTTRLNESSYSTHIKDSDSTEVTESVDMTREQAINVNDTDVYYVRPKRRVRTQPPPQEDTQTPAPQDTQTPPPQDTQTPQDTQEEVYIRPRRRGPRPKSVGGLPELKASPRGGKTGEGDTPAEHGRAGAARREVKLSSTSREQRSVQVEEGSVLSRYRGRSLLSPVMTPPADDVNVQNKASASESISSGTRRRDRSVDDIAVSTEINMDKTQGLSSGRIRSDHTEAKGDSLSENKDRLGATPSVVKEAAARQAQLGDSFKADRSESKAVKTDKKVGAKTHSSDVKSKRDESDKSDRSVRPRTGVELRQDSHGRTRDTTTKRHTISGDMSQLHKHGVREPADKHVIKPGVSLLKLQNPGIKEPAGKPIVKSELLTEQDRVVKLRLMFEKLGNGRKASGQKAIDKKLGRPVSIKGASNKEAFNKEASSKEASDKGVRGLMEIASEVRPKYTTEFKLNL